LIYKIFEISISAIKIIVSVFIREQSRAVYLFNLQLKIVTQESV